MVQFISKLHQKIFGAILVFKLLMDFKIAASPSAFQYCVKATNNLLPIFAKKKLDYCEKSMEKCTFKWSKLKLTTFLNKWDQDGGTWGTHLGGLSHQKLRKIGGKHGSASKLNMSSRL